MVGLTPQVVKSVSLTKQEGEPFLLDGNRLYFSYEERGKHGKTMKRYGYVDLESRKSFTRVELSEVPKWPNKFEATVNVYEVAFGLWLVNYAGLTHCKDRTEEYLPVRQVVGSNRIAKSREEVTLKDFTAAAREDWSCRMMDDQPRKPAFWWDITDELMEKAKQIADNRKTELERVRNKGWKPMRVLDLKDTAAVLGIFTFDGDEKSLVTALRSWGAEIRDSDVHVDRKGFTKYVRLNKTVEELIP